MSDGRDGGTEYFMKCGDRYYIYLDISANLHRVEQPTELSKILGVLDYEQWVGLELTDCDLLLEYGGPNKVLDEEVPPGWPNQNEQIRVASAMKF